MSITTQITSAVKSIASSQVNKLLGGFPGAAALNGIMGKAFGKLIDGIASSINSIPILAEVAAFANELGDSIFSAAGGLGESFGSEISDLIAEGGDSFIEAESLLEGLQNIAGQTTPGSAIFNQALGDAATVALKGGNIRAVLDSLITSTAVPVLTGIGSNIASTALVGPIKQITNALGDIPVVLGEALPSGALPAGTELVFDEVTGQVFEKVKRGVLAGEGFSLKELPNIAVGEVLKTVSAANVSQVKNAQGETVFQIIPSGSEALRDFPVTEETIETDDGDTSVSAGASFIEAAIQTAKAEQAKDPTKPVILANVKIRTADGNSFPIPDLRVPRSIPTSSKGVKNLVTGAIIDTATKVGTELLQRAVFSVFPALPIPQGTIRAEARKSFSFQLNAEIAGLVNAMQTALRADLNKVVDEISSNFNAVVNTGIQTIDNSFFGPDNTEIQTLDELTDAD